MTYNMDNKQDRLILAAAFRKVGNDFKKLCQDNKLDHTYVDMSEPYDRRNEHHHLCNTPACHGGWGSILYGVGDEADGSDFYQMGADAIAKKLGFSEAEELTHWAEDWPGYWGNEWGDEMFSSGSAFGESSQHFPLTVIYEHYFSVGDRLSEADL